MWSRVCGLSVETLTKDPTDGAVEEKESHLFALDDADVSHTSAMNAEQNDFALRQSISG